MTNVPVTDADREALWLRLLDSCKGGPQWEYARACEDADAQAIARARAEERAQIHATLTDLPEPFAYRHDPIRLDAFNEGVQHAMDAIRARGEKGKD